MAEVRMFLVEKGKFVILRDENGTEVGFASFEDFYKYCPIAEFSIDLTGKNYIDYEPDRGLYIDDSDSGISVANAPVAVYEAIINSIDTIQNRVNDPYYGVNLAEAKALKIQTLRAEANNVITATWPLYTQLNINAGIAGTGDKTQKDADVVAVRNECNSKESAVDGATDVAAVQAITANWPSL